MSVRPCGLEPQALVRSACPVRIEALAQRPAATHLALEVGEFPNHKARLLLEAARMDRRILRENAGTPDVRIEPFVVLPASSTQLQKPFAPVPDQSHAKGCAFVLNDLVAKALGLFPHALVEPVGSQSRAKVT